MIINSLTCDYCIGLDNISQVKLLFLFYNFSLYEHRLVAWAGNHGDGNIAFRRKRGVGLFIHQVKKVSISIKYMN